MSRWQDAFTLIALVASSSLLCHQPVRAADAEAIPSTQNPPVAQPGPAGAPAKLVVTVGKSLIIDSPLNIIRVHVSNGDLAEAVAVNPKEVLINGKQPGETMLIIWQQNGARLQYDLAVRMSGMRLEAARQQISREFPDENINLMFDNDTAFVRGTVKDVTAADRVMAIASSLGKAVNLLNVQVPPVEPQVLLKVRFANVDRSAMADLGVNLANYAFNQGSAVGTSAPVSLIPNAAEILPSGNAAFSVAQAVNILLWRRDINLVAAIQALQTKRVLELLAEPNLLSISGEQASFLAGGEFPFPVIQPGGAGGTASVTIMWREYGIRLNFLPTVTPRGTIRLKVAPEVSSLDYTNAVSVMGQTIPGLSSRRVQTEVELDSGQSFVIAGLLDNQASESFSKVPGIGSIPVLGKLFQSKTISRSNSELLVMITPEVVRPIPSGQTAPDIHMPVPFLKDAPTAMPRTPGIEQTGPVPTKAPVETLPYERLAPRPNQGPAPALAPLPANFGPTPMQPNAGGAAAQAPAPAAPASGSGVK